MAQLEQNNGDSLINENEKGKQLIEDITIKNEEKAKHVAENITIKDEEKGKQLIKDEISKIGINNDNMIVDNDEDDDDDNNNNNNNNNNNCDHKNVNNCTLEDLSELACQIDFDNNKKNDNNNKNNNIINNNNNGHVATCVAGHSQTSTDDNTPLPLWVKWRNKWQTGIRCPLSDCPSSTLKAKPTHEMKSYIPVFFPRSKAYCWISTLHSRHISEAPEPLKNGSHSKWRKIVRDFATVTKSHAMEKLALAMLSLTDQLHVQAVIEEARKGDAWKEFALEASACDNYCDLGNMLVKLRNMILSDYISSEWLKSKFESWVQKCRCAQNAESLESLTEELVQNILWNKIEELWTGSTQNNQTPEFKTLKQDMMKLFITSRETLKRPIQNFPNLETPQSSRKRPKLEVRRPGQQEVKPDPLDPLTQTDQLTQTPNNNNNNNNNKSGYTYKQCTAFIESKGRQCERWANDGDVYCCVHLHASNGSDKRVGFAKPSDPLSNSKGYTYRQCAAFIESKGRQCERWASDGDIYCCVHLYVNNTTGSDKRVGSDQLTPITTTSNKGYTYRQCAAFIESKGRQCERWASDGDVYCCVHLNGSDKRIGFVDPLTTQTPNNNNNNKSGYTYKQCGAFIESKGRQCERWANEGDLYCCVHLNIRVDQNEKRAPLDSPLCKGTTTNGTNCKHRAKPGSNFCKKHVNSPIGNNNVNNGNNNNIKKNVVTEIISFGNNDNNGKNNIGRISFVPTPVPIPVPVFFENKPEIYKINKNNTNNNVNNDNNEMICTPSTSVNNLNISELRCIGERANANENFSICQEYAKKYDLYCQNHIPKFLKRARDGRSRPITKEVILNLFKTCPSRKEKLLLHRACELLYAFLKSKLLVRKPKFDMSDKMEIITSVVNNDPEVGEYLINLISHEREKLASIWGLDTSNNNNNINKSSNNKNNNNNVLTNNENFGGVKCKFCLEDFSDDHKLTLHWTQVHKKEARWLFRGYACKICMEGFNNRKLLESHIGEKHNALESVQELTLFRCISCNMHFTSPDPLWQHVLAFHVAEFKVDNNNYINNNNDNNVSNNNDNNEGGFMHRRGKYQLNRFKLNKNEGGNNLKNVGKVANIIMNNNNNQIIVQEMTQNENNLGDLMDSDCINVAQILFSEIKKSKSHPSNSEILNFAKETCCKISLLNKLVEKFGVLPENIYLKAAKLCSESDVRIEWFKDSFICVNGCENSIIKPVLGPLNNNNNVLEGSLNDALNEMQVDEYHVVIDSNQFEGLNWEEREKLGFILLCEDLSFGKEKLGIPCFLEREIRVLERENEIIMPWKDFTYVTERIFNQPIDQPTMDEELGCACSSEGCDPNKCDHVYLFDNDYENVSDINGKNMHEKFAYDENGRIILQEGYPVYECNNSCKCGVNCNNRVIQKGICVKLEVFRTKSKGWAVRADEDIKCGTFICEIIGEVINNEEATQRRERQKKDGCNYLCEIESHMGHMLSEETLPYVIDSFKYGNISRFINHSCSPNLSSYLVLSESMDCQLAHVALFANCNINAGEELCYDYKHKIIDGEKCYCGSHSCRGQI